MSKLEDLRKIAEVKGDAWVVSYYTPKRVQLLSEIASAGTNFTGFDVKHPNYGKLPYSTETLFVSYPSALEFILSLQKQNLEETRKELESLKKKIEDIESGIDKTEELIIEDLYKRGEEIVSSSTFGWLHTKVRNVDGRKGVVIKEEPVGEYDLKLRIATDSGKVVTIRLNNPGPDSGDPDWQWLDSESDRWYDLGRMEINNKGLTNV